MPLVRKREVGINLILLDKINMSNDLSATKKN